MKSIQRVVDTRELVTRLYAVGAEGMTFADINGGRPYVEDFTYTNEIRISTLDCSSFTNPYQMKEYAEMRLADYAKPTISYVLNAMDLSVLTGYEHEAWELGDYVRVEDKELGLSVTTRIVRREYNLQEAVEHGAGIIDHAEEPGQLRQPVGQCGGFAGRHQYGIQ